MLNFSSRPDKVKKHIQFINGDKESWDVVKTIHFQDKFPFMYDVHKLTDIDTNYLDPAYNVNNFI